MAKHSRSLTPPPHTRAHTQDKGKAILPAYTDGYPINNTSPFLSSIN